MKRLFFIFLIIVDILFADKNLLKREVRQWLASLKGFEQNLGQVSDFEENAVKNAYARLNFKDFSIFITEKGISFVLYQSEETSNLHYARFDLELVNGEIKKENIDYGDEILGYTNYYLPTCPDAVFYLKTYRKVRIKDVYRGIDWVFKIENGEIHYEFEIEPYADIKDIKMKAKWADVDLDEGFQRLRYKTPIGEILDGKVIAYEGKKEAPVLCSISDEKR